MRTWLVIGALIGSFGTAHAGQAPAGQPPAPPAPGVPPPAPVEPQPPFSLEESIQYAMQNNPRVAQAEAFNRRSQELIRQRRGERGPRVGIDGFYQQQGPIIPAFSVGSDPVFPGSAYNLGIAARQPVFDSGLRSANLRSARSASRAETQETEQTRDDVALQVSVAYYNVFRAQQIQSVAQARVSSAQEQLRVAEARFASDVAPRFDVIRSQAELADARQELIEAQNEVALAESTFNNVLGRDLTQPVALEGPQPVPGLQPDMGQAIAAAQRYRPELLAIPHRIESARQDVRAARAANRPAVDLYGGYLRRSATGFSSPYTFDAGLGITFPFFDSGVTRARAGQARETLRAEEALSENTRQAVELAIQQALLNVREARQRIETAQQELAQAQESLRIAQVRYQAGVGTNVEVTDAQEAATRAGTNLANSTFDLRAAISVLEHATGTTLAQIAQMPVPPATTASTAK